MALCLGHDTMPPHPVPASTLGVYPLPEPALSNNESNQEGHLAGSDVRELRRWLWSNFNVSSRHRLPTPTSATLVGGNAPAAVAAALRSALADMVSSGACTVTDALAWSKLACLEGRRPRRTEVEGHLGLSARGLDKRLSAVDRQIASFLSTSGSRAHAPASPEAVVLYLLMESVLALKRGHLDAADGLRAAARDFTTGPRRHITSPVGRGRVERSRIRGLARKTAGIAASSVDVKQLEALPRTWLGGSKAAITQDPDQAISVLHQAWSEGESEGLPVFLAQAIGVALDRNMAGTSRRLHLLEIGSNIFRDAESLEALAWTTLWIREAGAGSQTNARARISGLKTRAHVLQLHGFLGLAQRDLERSRVLLLAVREPSIDQDLIAVDVVLRRAALSILQGDVQSARHFLSSATDLPKPAHMNLSKLRHDLHLESLELSQTLLRRSFRAARSTRFETALSRLLAFAATESKELPLSVMDTVIASCMRVGDTETIQQTVRSSTWSLASANANVLDRLRLRLAAASKMPGLRDMRDVPIPSSNQSFGQPGAVPTQLQFLL
jgi:hypothetical protein